MAAILDEVLLEHVPVNDFKTWLLSDSVEDLSKKDDFITYFLNIVRENCLWLLSKNAKSADSPSSKSECGIRSKTLDQNYHPSHDSSSFLKSESPKNRNDDGASKHNRNVSKNNQSFLQDSSQNRIKINNGPHLQYEVSKKSYVEQNNRKSDYSARKSLNFNSSKQNKHTIFANNIVQAPDISSFEVFPPVGSKDNKHCQQSKTKRRITPTPIQVVHKGSSKFGSQRFVTPTEKVSNEVFNLTPVVEIGSSDLKKEREMLKMTRDKLLLSSTISNDFSSLKVDNNNISPIKSVKVANYVDPNPDKISHVTELEKFSVIYDLLLSHALVPNVTSELYFIFELVTSRVLPQEEFENKNSIFSSIHNCMYFAISVLNKLKSLLHLLDNSTLYSLSEIPYLPKFSSELIEYLHVCCNEKEEVSTKSQSLTRVPFILDEDSIEHFLDNHAFTSFRKQRDLFYELLRDWQQQPLDCTDSRFRDSFSRKAKNLISIAPNTVNLHHLAKLFQNQLIASCLGLEVNEIYDELLSDIQKNFPGKIEKLRQRFMMPLGLGGPSPPPSFHGIQAFFSNLIQAADSTTLNQHLQDIFVSKILELNSTDILADSESNSLVVLKEKYIFLLHTLRLLGKYLGFLHFLPYKVCETLSPNILNQQLVYRKNSVPPIDVPKLLKYAIENKRVILTVPWIVEYLSMADPVGKILPYIKEILVTLNIIYQEKYFIQTQSFNFWFLRLIIGWLFDILNYPIKFSSPALLSTVDLGIQNIGLDSLAVVDKQLIHSCCPYLLEFKMLVFSFLNGIKKDKKREIRKITPLSTVKPVASTSLAEHQLEEQLEENFFFLHPPSLKKTVDFVSERMASKVIQRIRCEVTDFKLESVESITKHEAYKALLRSSSKQKQKFVDSYILELYKKSQSKIEEFIHVKCPKDVKNILPSLLPDDIHPSVLKMSCEICLSLAVEKIMNWCNANLLVEDIKSDIQNKLNHLSKGDADNNNEDDFNLSSLLTSLRKCILKYFSGSDILSTEYIPLLLEIAFLMDKPINTTTKKLLAQLSIDLYVAILVNCPNSCASDFEKSLISIWSLCPKSFNLESYLLGVHNIKLLITGNNFEMSCQKLELILTEVVNNKCFSAQQLRNCQKSWEKCQWNDPKAQMCLNCLSVILSKFGSNDLNKVTDS